MTSRSVNAAQAKLIRENLTLVAPVLAKLRRTHRDLRTEEGQSWGYEALVRAATVFDPGKGVPFEAFAALQIRWTVLHALRHERMLRRRLLLADALPREHTDDDRFGIAGLTGSSAESHGTGEDEIADAQSARRAIEALARARAQLPADQARLVQDLYERGLRLEACAERAGASQSTIRRRHALALKRLRRSLQRAGVRGEHADDRGRSNVAPRTPPLASGA